MSLDLEDRVEHGLADLARQAPVPVDWPDLGTPVLWLDRRSTSRPRLVTGLVAAAASIVVISALAFVVNRDPGAPPTRPAIAPPSTGANAASTALGGRWSQTGPRLTDEQLGSIVATTSEDGSSIVVPRSGFDVDEHGPRPDRTHRVVDVSVARIDAATFSADVPSGDGFLTAEQRMAILQYVASIPPPGAATDDAAVPSTDGADVLLAVVRTTPLDDPSTGSESACQAPYPTDGPGCTSPSYDYIWVFPATGVADQAGGMMARIPHVDVLAGLGPVGRWTPAAAPEPTAHTDAPTVTTITPPSQTTNAETVPSTTALQTPSSTSPAFPPSSVPSQPGASSLVPPSAPVPIDPDRTRR